MASISDPGLFVTRNTNGPATNNKDKDSSSSTGRPETGSLARVSDGFASSSRSDFSSSYVRPAPQKFLDIAPRAFTALPNNSNNNNSNNIASTSSSKHFDVSHDFSSFSLNPRLSSGLTQRLGLARPTLIQAKAIPHMLAGRDVFMQSPTGSGKTLAYLIPLVEDLLRSGRSLDRAMGTMGLVIVPTRELAAQINAVCQRLLADCNFLVCGCLMGGEKKKSEKARIRKGLSVLIATPGRLLDHLSNTKSLIMSSLRWIILDEADRLVDMGFEADVKEILRLCRSRLRPGHSLHSVLVSATLSDQINTLAQFALKEPVHISSQQIDKPADATNTSDSATSSLVSAERADGIKFPSELSHSLFLVDSAHRLVALAAFLRQRTLLAQAKGGHCKAIVFFSTCASVEFHYLLLSNAYWPPSPAEAAPSPALLTSPIFKLHGSLAQSERMSAFQQFRRCASGLLFCTDVAARGLDLPAVELVVQYDPAEDLVDYVHRAGRSARLGALGESVLMITQAESAYLTKIEEAFGFKKFVPLNLPRVLASLKINAREALDKLNLPAGALLQREFEALVSGNPALHQLAVSAYQSFVRAYAAYPRTLKACFHPKQLHFGHVARAFGLAEEPGKLKKVYSNLPGKRRSGDDNGGGGPAKKRMTQSATSMAMSEFQ